MAPNKEGQSKEDEGDRDETAPSAASSSGVGSPYTQATDDQELAMATACFSGNNGKIYGSRVAMRVLYPLHVEPPHQPRTSTPATSSSPSQVTIPDTEGASCRPENILCSAQAVSNTADKASSSLVEIETSNPQHTLTHNSEHTGSTGQRPPAPRKARTAHPSQTGEPPTGATNTDPPVASLDETLPDGTASPAISPRFCLLVTLDDGDPTSFLSQYGRDLEGEIPQEDSDSASSAPLRELLSSDIELDFTEFESSPIPFTDVRDFDFTRMEMQSESMDSAYFSNQMN